MPGGADIGERTRAKLDLQRRALCRAQLREGQDRREIDRLPGGTPVAPDDGDVRGAEGRRRGQRDGRRGLDRDHDRDGGPSAGIGGGDRDDLA